MKQTKHILLLVALLLGSLTASAHDFEVDGIYYNITSNTEVEVTYKGYDSSDYEEYSGPITIPATVTYNGKEYSVTSIGDYAFSHCYGLTSITIPESVTSIGWYAFCYCSSLTTITIPEGVTLIGSYTFSGCSSLASISIPESVTSIGDGAFCYCSSLTSISIPEGVTSIGSYAFEGCSSLTSVTIPEGVTSIGYGAFYGCSSLTSITIPESVTSIGDWAFSGCSSLTSMVVAEGNTIYDSRNNCNAIIETSSNTLIAGCSSTIIPEGVTSIGSYAFGGCSSLTAITIPEGVTSIGSYTFSGCSSLTYITIPENSQLTSIGEDAFFGCSSFEYVTINCPEVGSWFRNMPSIKKIVLGEGVTSIENYAFYGCSGLTSITCHAITPPTIGSGRSPQVFNGVDKSIPVYVPLGSVEAYQAAKEWKNFTNFIGADLTSIDNPEFTIQNSALIYDLHGRRVAHPTKGGIYIVNGKKVSYEL